MKAFSSDNYSGVSKEIMQAILDANQDHESSYGNDPYTEKAIGLFKKTFGESISVYFVCNGTAANVLALQAVTQSYQAVICADSSHIVNHEVGAVTKLIGCMLVTVPNEKGKISAAAIEEAYLKTSYWGRHANAPKVVSIAQATELGTVYTIDELKKISEVCKKYNLFFHMDGCRLANAAVHLNTSLKSLTADVGVDVLSFGGTKNGLLYGEAIVFFRKELADNFDYIQKQGLQLQSKMRFLSAQFIPYLEKNLYYTNAQQANAMCARLLAGLEKLDSIELVYPAETNQLFASFPKYIIEPSQKIFPYYLWDAGKNVVRLVTSFDSTTTEVDDFLKIIAVQLSNPTSRDLFAGSRDRL